MATPTRHPAFFSLASLALITPLCVLGAIIGTQLITTLGITTNTALLGALGGMALGRVPAAVFARYRSVHMQNLAQSAISAATFGAGNALLLPIGIPFVMGRADLVAPMFLGVFIAMLVDGFMLYRMFGSEIFPATGTWPPGVAAAEAIRAGDQGGRKGLVLLGGLAVGLVGSYFFTGVMSAFGVAFIGNIWALTMFGAGLLLRGYSALLFSDFLPKGDINAAFIPHGVMVGAGLVALVQVLTLILRPGKAAAGSTRAVRGTLALGSAAYVGIAVLLALLGGLFSAMSPGMLLGFVVYAAFAALAHELIVGLAAMHAGWFPAFAVALITLVIGMLLGFPPVALTLLVGFSAATGPAFADMGYDLKAGYMLRGDGADPAFEADGRRQQLYAAMFAFVVAGAVVLVSYPYYFAAGQIPPVDRVYASTINAGASLDIAQKLALWAIPGAVIQALGGRQRQLGVLLATGLLINFAAAGWAVLLGVVLRAAWTRATHGRAQSSMEVFGAGVIAGDALWGFGSSMAKMGAMRK